MGDVGGGAAGVRAGGALEAVAIVRQGSGCRRRSSGARCARTRQARSCSSSVRSGRLRRRRPVERLGVADAAAASLHRPPPAAATRRGWALLARLPPSEAAPRPATPPRPSPPARRCPSACGRRRADVPRLSPRAARRRRRAEACARPASSSARRRSAASSRIADVRRLRGRRLGRVGAARLWAPAPAKDGYLRRLRPAACPRACRGREGEVGTTLDLYVGTCIPSMG